MNEKQWASEKQNSQFMLLTLKTLGIPRTKAGRRKLRLFAAGCCRAVWHLLPEQCLRSAVDVAERFADGSASQNELTGARTRVERVGFADREVGDVFAWNAATCALESCEANAFHAAAGMTERSPSPFGKGAVAERFLCDLLHCVFGNPFQKAAFPKKWRSETVTALATGIYEEWAFDRLPILADALEEAGCDDPAMLAHLRSDGPHCRGCWMVDLALGK
jgi:hypothetical protein